MDLIGSHCKCQLLQQQTLKCDLMCSKCNICNQSHENQCKSNVSSSALHTLPPNSNIFGVPSVYRGSRITFREEIRICTPDNNGHKIHVPGSLPLIDASQDDSIHSPSPVCERRNLSVPYTCGKKSPICELRSTNGFKGYSNSVYFDPIKEVKHGYIQPAELQALQLHRIQILLLQILQNLKGVLSCLITTFSGVTDGLYHEGTLPMQGHFSKDSSKKQKEKVGLQRRSLSFLQRVLVISSLTVCCAKVTSCAHPRECINSIQTLKKVQDCPINKQKWIQAANLKRCDSIQQNCSSTQLFQYHCLLDHTGEGLVEVCAPVSNVIGQYCAEYDMKANIIQSRSGASCKSFETPCPFKYSSNTSYLYQGCYKPIRSISKLSMSTENQSISYTTVNHSKGFYKGETRSGSSILKSFSCLLLILMFISVKMYS